MNFIKQLKVKNFFSIKDEVILNLEASEYTRSNHIDRTFENIDDKLYNKLISIYGANASGKTTLLKAFVVIGAIVNNEKSDAMPYSIKNKFAHANSKTEITLDFTVSIDGEILEFQYELSLDAKKSKINHQISNEILYIIKDGKRSTYFNRKDRKINIDDIDDKTKEIVFENLKPTISVFKEFEKFDGSKTVATIKSFLGNIPKLTNINSAFFTTFGIKKEDEEKLLLNILNDNKLENFLVKFLLSIGMDIKSIDVEFEYDDDKQIKGIKDILIYHDIDSKVPLEYKLESDGTKMLFKILIDIYLAKKLNTVLVIDEFDSVLHSMLVPLLNKLAIDNNVQLIYTTHNIYNMKFLYADEIYIIEKDKKHKTSIIEPKDNQKVKGFENFLALYENNYLGGLPVFEDIFTKIEDGR